MASVHWMPQLVLHVVSGIVAKKLCAKKSIAYKCSRVFWLELDDKALLDSYAVLTGRHPL